MGWSNIAQLLPLNYTDAIFNANNPDISNPFATIADVISASTNITNVANYSALPLANLNINKYYWCESSQGTPWLPGSLGGTYYSAGLYYSNGITWGYLNVPYQATQSEVNTGTNDDKFVTPLTFTTRTNAIFQTLGNLRTTWQVTPDDTHYPSEKLTKDSLDGKEPSITIAGANAVWHGNKTFSAVVEADITLANNTTNNADLTKHGFLPILPGNALLFLDGVGNYSLPTAGIVNAYKLTTFSGQTSITVTHGFGTYPVVTVTETIGSNHEVVIPKTIRHTSLNSFTVEFDVATTGHIIASVGSPQPNEVRVVTVSGLVLLTDKIIDVTSSGITLTLPTAIGNTGFEFHIDNDSLADIYATCLVGGQLIQGETIQTIPKNSCMGVYCNGTNYRFF